MFCRQNTTKSSINSTESNHPKLCKSTKIGRKKRTVFHYSQMDVLEEEFDKSQYLTGDDRKQLAARLQLNEMQVSILIEFVSFIIVRDRL